jgi:hypothetical protein
MASQTDVVKIAYSAADNRYMITLPGYQEGQLVPKGGSGSANETGWINLISTYSEVTVGAGPQTQDARVILDWPGWSKFKYANFGNWERSCPELCPLGVFAYGIPTSAADVPTAGSASYNGEVRGLTDHGWGVGGTVFLSFNFGAGTLSGHMQPLIAEWDPVPLGTYTFRDTVYSAGSTKFSGAFQVADTTGASSFSGSFTGPGAAELMASWQAPFIDPSSKREGRMAGAWIAKKD